MFKSLSKRTKVSLGILGGLVIIAVGLMVYTVSTGGLKSLADIFRLAGSPGKISGYIYGKDNCTIGGAKIIAQQYEYGPAYPGSINYTDGYYVISNLPIHYYLVSAYKSCPPTTGYLGRCDGYNTVTLTDSQPEKSGVNISLNPSTGRLKIAVRQIIQPSGPKPANCTVSEGMWDCPVSGALVTSDDGKIRKYTDSGGVVDWGLHRVGDCFRVYVSKPNYSTKFPTICIEKGCSQNVFKVYLKKE